MPHSLVQLAFLCLKYVALNSVALKLQRANQMSSHFIRLNHVKYESLVIKESLT